MISVLVDADIVLDLLSARKPFYAYAAQLFSMAERGGINLFISALIFANLHYILRGQHGAAVAMHYLRKLKLMMGILPVDGQTIELALTSDFNDLNDAIQYFVAYQAGLPYLITRNVQVFSGTDIHACSAEDFFRTKALKT